MIRDWLMAVQHGDFGRAATFFAPGAIIDQGRPVPAAQPGRGALLQRHAALPRGPDRAAGTRAPGCSPRSASRPGPGGPCHGRVQVRYTIVDGKFTEWRQLPTPAASAPPGPVV